MSVVIFVFEKKSLGIQRFIFIFLDDVSNPQVLVVIQSAPKNKNLRDEVRRTWGKSCVTTHNSWCSLVFILGQLSNDTDPLQDEIENEFNEYGDILQDSFLDSYNNLTIKSIHILKYFVSISDTLGKYRFLISMGIWNQFFFSKTQN